MLMYRRCEPIIMREGVVQMRQLRKLVCGMGLVLALAPFGTFASEESDHSQAELTNALAQLQLARQEAIEFGDEAALSAANERQIAFLESEALRQAQLDNAANATAFGQIATTLAAAMRAEGTASAQNELAILQIKANTLLGTASANLANAQAMGRQDEITNAQAQSMAAQQLAEYLTGTLAQQNMTSARVSAEDEAAWMQASLEAEAQNEMAMGAEDVFAADSVLDAADVAAESSLIAGQAEGVPLVAHAEASLDNAEAMVEEAAP